MKIYLKDVGLSLTGILFGFIFSQFHLRSSANLLILYTIMPRQACILCNKNIIWEMFYA